MKSNRRNFRRTIGAGATGLTPGTGLSCSGMGTGPVEDVYENG